jgi:hypothetical protein
VPLLNVNRKGVIGLVKVTADLISRGYEVFTPTSDFSPVDVVVAEPVLWSLRRLQVKYRKIGRDGGAHVSLDSVVNGRRVPVDTSRIDGWAVYCPEPEFIAYVRADEVAGRGFRVVPGDAASLVDPQRLWVYGR